MVQELVEEVLWGFVNNVSLKIGVALRWIWFGRRLGFEEILDSKWNIRIGMVIVCLVVTAIIVIIA